MTQKKRGSDFNFVSLQMESTHGESCIRDYSSEGCPPALCVRSTFHFAFDVVTFAEEGKPVVEHFLVLVR
jgi:hypothetical protein